MNLLSSPSFLYINEESAKAPYISGKLKKKVTMESSVVENIVIVGAGIAGLATSLALHRFKTLHIHDFIFISMFVII